MKRLWVDAGDFRTLVDPRTHSHETWADHGGGLLLTILKNEGIEIDRLSLRQMSSWGEFRGLVKGYDLLAMNSRSYTWPMVKRAARIFKEVNPKGVVVSGGMHATVAYDEMEPIEDVDHIISGAGELVAKDLMLDPSSFPRHIMGQSSRGMDDWPWIDRTMWPDPRRDQPNYPWPLERPCGWEPPGNTGAVVTIITSRVCPWHCVFCNENSYIETMGRRSVDSIIEELNWLDAHHGPIGSIVFHDSMFLQSPKWLKEFIEKYPRKTKNWPYWAAGRSDTVRQWPDLVEALVRETNWHTVSIGFESGSDRVLEILNKECTAQDNYFAIDLLNNIGDDMESKGLVPPKFFANIMLAIPGETREDAFETVRMLKRMKRVLPSIAYYAPYPGSALGYQLIAEGKSLMSADNYHRYPDDRKVKDIDYDFYDALLAGQYEKEVDEGASMQALMQSQGGYGLQQSGAKDKRHMFQLREVLTKA